VKLENVDENSANRHTDSRFAKGETGADMLVQDKGDVRLILVARS
jgi:hypothetical protein